MENQNQNEGQNVQRNIFTQWLEKLQQESWQLELVISGLALYLVYEARVYIEDFAVYAEMYDYTALNPISFASDLFYGSWVIFIINLIVHILARGFWIGAIGLRYVSGEVDYKSLNYSEIFEKHLEKKVGRFDVYIEKLERFCSILYAYTFLLFFIFVSLMAYFGVFVLIISGVESLTDNLDSSDQGIFISMIALPYFLLGLIYGIDVVFMGGFKKVKDKTISKIYFYIYRVFNILTLSFFYRALVYNFIDNAYSRRFIWFSIPYFLIVFICIPNIKVLNSANFPIPEGCMDCTSEHLVFWNNYDDLRYNYLLKNNVSKDKTIIPLVSLNSYEVSGDHLSLFLRMINKDDKYLEKIEGIPPNFKTGFITEIQDEWVSDTLEENIKKIFTKQKSEVLKLRKSSKDEKNRKELLLRIDSLDDVKWDSLRKYWAGMDHLRLKTFLKIFDVQIDNVSYSDSLQCKWYIHPNKGEKGVLCYIPVKSMENGFHNIYIKRKMHKEKNDDKFGISKDTFGISHINIPFYKLKE